MEFQSLESDKADWISPHCRNSLLNPIMDCEKPGDMYDTFGKPHQHNHSMTEYISYHSFYLRLAQQVIVQCDNGCEYLSLLTI